MRKVTLHYFARLISEQLAAIVLPVPGSAVEWSLRSWLWHVLEHEVHHKVQRAEYTRQMGMVPPFFVDREEGRAAVVSGVGCCQSRRVRQAIRAGNLCVLKSWLVDL